MVYEPLCSAGVFPHPAVVAADAGGTLNVAPASVPAATSAAAQSTAGHRATRRRVRGVLTTVTPFLENEGRVPRECGAAGCLRAWVVRPQWRPLRKTKIPTRNHPEPIDCGPPRCPGWRDPSRTASLGGRGLRGRRASVLRIADGGRLFIDRCQCP